MRDKVLKLGVEHRPTVMQLRSQDVSFFILDGTELDIILYREL